MADVGAGVLKPCREKLGESLFVFVIFLQLRFQISVIPMILSVCL